MTKKTTIFEKAQARATALIEKIRLAGPNAELFGTIASQKVTITELEGTIAALRLENAEIAQLRATNKELASHASSVSLSAIDQVASLGFSARSLPAATSEDHTAGEERPASVADFAAKHSELTKKDPIAASVYYKRWAPKWGLA